MLAVKALLTRARTLEQGLAVDPAVLVGDLLQHGNGRALGALDRTHELAGLVKALHGAGVKPGVAATEGHDRERAVLQVHAVEVGDLQLAAGARLDPPGQLADALVIEVQASDRVGALGVLGLLLDGDGVEVLVELHHAEALGIVHVVAEDRCASPLLGVLHRATQVAREAVAVEDVVAQHERAGLAGDEPLADDERLSKPVWTGLLGVGQAHAEIGAVTQQALEVGQVRRRRDDENVTNARHHEDRQRVVNHGLVVHGQQLLAGDRGERVQAGARSAREDDAFHAKPFRKKTTKSSIIIAAMFRISRLIWHKSGFLNIHPHKQITHKRMGSWNIFANPYKVGLFPQWCILRNRSFRFAAKSMWHRMISLISLCPIITEQHT